MINSLHVEGHWVITSKAAVNSHLQVCVWIKLFFSLRWMLKSAIVHGLFRLFQFSPFLLPRPLPGQRCRYSRSKDTWQPDSQEVLHRERLLGAHRILGLISLYQELSPGWQNPPSWPLLQTWNLYSCWKCKFWALFIRLKLAWMELKCREEEGCYGSSIGLKVGRSELKSCPEKVPSSHISISLSLSFFFFSISLSLKQPRWYPHSFNSHTVLLAIVEREADQPTQGLSASQWLF